MYQACESSLGTVMFDKHNYNCSKASSLSEIFANEIEGFVSHMRENPEMECRGIRASFPPGTLIAGWNFLTSVYVDRLDDLSGASNDPQIQKSVKPSTF
jgi:hypothetical protein